MRDCPPVIDYSSWQGRADLTQVKAEGVEAVYVRWGYNHVSADSAYSYNFIEADRAELDFGGYQVLVFNRDPIWQADQYLAGLFDSALLPVVDLERGAMPSAKQNASNAKAWLDQVESHLGVKPMIYTRGYWFDLHLGNYADWASEYPLWVANYTTRSIPRIPKQWKNHALWQYADKQTIRGISGAIDFNRYGNDPRGIYR